MAIDEKKSADPAATYGTPEQLAEDRRLDDQAKRMLLRQWQKDLMQLMTASEENMPSTITGPARAPTDSDNAELLRRVSDCLLRFPDAAKKTRVGQKVD